MPTLQFITISFFFHKNATASCLVYSCFAKSLSKYQHVKDSNPQNILWHCRMVNKIGQNTGSQQKGSQSVAYDFKPLLRDTTVTNLVPRAFPYPFFKGKALGTRLYGNTTHLLVYIYTVFKILRCNWN